MGQGFTDFDQLRNPIFSNIPQPPPHSSRPGHMPFPDFQETPNVPGLHPEFRRPASSVTTGLRPPGLGNHLAAPRTSSRSHRSHYSTGNVPYPLGAPPAPPLSQSQPYRPRFDHLPPNPPSSAPPLPVPQRGVHAALQHQHPQFSLDQPVQKPPPPRRQLAEEDECPVCGNELPPKGPNGEEADRERHVEECIASHFVGSSSGHRGSTSTEAAASAPSQLVGASSSSAPPTASPFSNLHVSGLPRAESSAAGAGGRPEPTRRRATGNRMLAYVATEKDCIGEDDEAAECVICLEEFEPGQEMARLNCWCKFHKVSFCPLKSASNAKRRLELTEPCVSQHCIRGWWETKGSGSCPTHQLHD